MFDNMNFGKGITYKCIDFNVSSQIPLLAQIDELKEDLIQVQYGNLLLDVGWYPEFDENGEFRIMIIKDNLWDNMYRQQSLITLDEFYELKPLTKLEAILTFIDFTLFLEVYPESFLRRGPKGYSKKQPLMALIAMQVEYIPIDVWMGTCKV